MVFKTVDKNSYNSYYVHMNQNTQTVYAAKAAKNRFGELLDTAQRTPVSIQKHGRTVAVVLSAHQYAEYKRLVSLDDAYWGEKATKVMQEGKFLGHEKSMRYINSILHAKNKSSSSR